MINISVPGHVHAATDETGCVTLLNEKTGHWHVLNPTAASVWRLAREGLSSTHAASAIAARFPDAPPAVIEADVEELIRDLARRNLIVIQDTEASMHDLGEIPMAAVFPETTAYSTKHVVAVRIAFPAAVVLTLLPFAWTTRLLRTLKARCDQPQATAEEAGAIAAAASRTAHYYPGRAACYELALTIALAAAFLGSSVDWCLGVAPDPRRLHAWVEVGGHVIPVAPDLCAENHYHRILLL